MTTPPLPASPCLRVKLDYTENDNFLAGSRFYLSYAGAAPTAGNCVTLAGDIASEWATAIAPVVLDGFALTRVDVLDIASVSGNFGEWNGNNPGTMSGNALIAQVATNVEYTIPRRYRGGKPRMFLPPPSTAAVQDQGHWTTTHADNAATALSDFFTAIAALSIGAMGALAHVNLSYYSGFTNVTNSSGRTRAVPKYRTTALVDNVAGYAGKTLMGSQRRRRASTTY